ncbi:immunity 26/phosphotriesterase HocA family protein [Paenibacillus polymyxa]|uniref:Immunity 26/phosphotriesterase HocA family protein n=1 Tax=Paenibacillus polymyxa TaxID=1406 RepID=A0A8I1IRG8_PAEPO|nr:MULTISPECIES: immunity 26/phosphotriesterase HocA family protein [Paenibacillus]KAF6570542.1 immunity 26/phosphotriesterase HocA family protein [Paenibacillus sp. EKM206P]KAF6588002.1 immunity 26/phosphotriesterase HocA family protein [Paenibacillus sp. EKM205P]MBM0635954.1 immunity 26/phosphotriesterase HocA family protein [Paenibacillus polymyxa]
MNSWLTNALRPYFGLETLEEHWDVVEIKEGYFICMDGDVIRKRISSKEDAYGEADVEIFTRDRAFVLPKTARGKEKKLNYTSVSSITAEGVSFSAGIRRDRNISYVTAVNSKTGVRLPITGCEHLHSKEEIIDWLQRYPSLVPNDYDRKVERLKHMKNLRYKTIPGDIFRVEIDLFTDGYVLVVGDLRQMQKDQLFAKESIWNSVMTMPLFVRPYLCTSRDRSITLESITAAPLSDTTWIVMDDSFMRGSYERIGHKALAEEDIVFPMGYGSSIDSSKERIYRLSWGTGTISKPEEKTVFKSSRELLNNGVYSGVIADCFGPWEEREWHHTLDNPLYREERRKALAEFGFPEDISYDEFNRQTGGLTRSEYLAYLTRTYSGKRKMK